VTPDAEQLLGPAVAMSAGLHEKFDRNSIVRLLDALRHRHEIVTSADLRIVRGDGEAMTFNGLADIRQALNNLDPRKVVLAGSLLGLTSATILALRSLGFKIVTVFGDLGEAHRRRLEISGIRLIDLRAQRNKFSLFKVLKDLQEQGHILALRCDVPGHSRHTCRFLGYDVTCANLIEAYARLTGCAVLPIEAELVSDCEMTLTCRTLLSDAEKITQELLSQLEISICRDPLKYLWASTSIIFSDKRAIVNGFSYLPAILALRSGGHPECN
jgi:hypothetical protein